MAANIAPLARLMTSSDSSQQRDKEPIPTHRPPGRPGARAGKHKGSSSESPHSAARSLVALLCATMLLIGDSMILAQAQQNPAPAQGTVKLSSNQLDSLVAPIALYPDPLLSQTLVAATYPLEIIQLQQWLEKNKGLKDKALDDAVKKQDWDPSIQAMASLPDVVKRLADDVKWTTDLGNAFLAQQSDVMDAVQRMRKKAADKGTLKSGEQQAVETKVVESKQVIVIEQANPQVVYVPTYDPVVVYGPPVYPYPPIYYPPPGYYAAGMAISFGVGIAMGAAWGGGWGWGCGWGHNDVDININNNYNRQNINNVNRSGNSKWQHNPQHRGGAPYADRTTASRYGGTARGDSASARQASARQQIGQTAGRPQASSMDRGTGSRPQASAMDRGTSSRTPSSLGSGGAGGDRVGSRSVSSAGGSRSSGAFGGASSGMSGGATRSMSSRGSSSLGGSRGGGGGGRRR